MLEDNRRKYNMAIDLSSYVANTWAHKLKTNGDQKIKTILLAAGLGSRMAPLTSHHIPKPLFPLGGRTSIAESWLRKTVASGITGISMNLCVLSETLRNYFNDGLKYGAELVYVDEDTPSGTLGGVCKQALGKNAKQVMPNETMPEIDAFSGSTVFVISGDIVTNFGEEQLQQLYEIHKQKGSAFTVALTPIPWDKRGEFGTVDLYNPETLKGSFSKSGKIKEFREKDPNSPSNLNNASIYIIEMELLKALDGYRTEARVDVENPFYDFGKHVFQAIHHKLDYIKLPKDYTLWGVQYDGLWFDVGRKRDYLEVNEILLDGELKVDMPYEKFPWGYLGTGVDIDFSQVNITPPVVIGNNCIIEKGAEIGPYAVIGDDWHLESGSKVSHSVLWPRYEYHRDNGTHISLPEWKGIDHHQVMKDVSIAHSIVVGGRIQKSLNEQVADVLENGESKNYSIDWIPDKKRA
jgi:NDP-sugar pyrophosphorylase family protein